MVRILSLDEESNEIGKKVITEQEVGMSVNLDELPTVKKEENGVRKPTRLFQIKKVQLC